MSQKPKSQVQFLIEFLNEHESYMSTLECYVVLYYQYKVLRYLQKSNRFANKANLTQNKLHQNLLVISFRKKIDHL